MLAAVGDLATLAAVMRLIVLLLVSMTAEAGEPAPTVRPASSSTAEAGRLGAEYFVQKAGASWTYALGVDGKGRGRVSVNAIVEWRAQYSFSFGKHTGSGAWFARDGVWLERSSARGENDAVVLPATMTRGTRWSGPASIERGGGAPSQFEVMALEAEVELPTGVTVDHCLAVLETTLDGGEPWTHYYAPNIGKVAVLSPSGWFSRLVEFHSGSRHAE